MFEHLLLSRPCDGVFQITLNRPRQLNALAKKTIEELHTALADFEASPDCILLLTGAGRAFCFGADFQEFQDRASLPILLQMFQDLILKLYYCSKVTIAAINGFATGAGLYLALACDFRLAAEKTKLGEAYISMGLVPDGGGSLLLTRLVGPGRALEMFLSGEPVATEEALSLGMLHRIFPAQELQAKSLEFAANLVAKPQTALRLTKKLVKENLSLDLQAAMENEKQAQLVCFEDPIHQSIVDEFLEKRRKDRKM